ncbi:phosphohistidine phosphatase [Rubripirellula obstinata]|uniref:Phosphohistidine phosphatase n=2 Tax=Rubripirellula obstinata TaxID=406547 RepID=A0A5B1CNX1_9BACT|nr:phosphohistidine phosphatase [Rubripirellula obstinata]
MRHAKSDWDDRSLSDHDRPLNRRGKGDAPRMARWLHSIDSVPDVILCSSATRTMQTADLMLPLWENRPKLTVCESLYLSSPETIFNLIGEALQSTSRLLVIAHNPGISSITSHLADQSIQMPTAAVAVFAGQDAEADQANRWQYQTWMRPKALPSLDDTQTDSQSL